MRPAAENAGAEPHVSVELDWGEVLLGEAVIPGQPLNVVAVPHRDQVPLGRLSEMARSPQELFVPWVR